MKARRKEIIKISAKINEIEKYREKISATKGGSFKRLIKINKIGKNL